MRKKIKVKIIEESLWDRLPQHVKDEINGIINSKPKEMVEVVHGEWVVHKDSAIVRDRLITNYECSICHTWSRYHSNYCPDCGAKMEEVEE